MIRLRTFGALEVTNSAGDEARPLLRQPKRLALLAYLATAEGGLRPRENVLALFWPGLDDARARVSLNQAVHFLRLVLGPHVILTHGSSNIGVDSASIWCDAVAFEQALDGRRHEEALSLYRGAFLDGFHLSGAREFEDWADGHRRVCEARAGTAARTVADRHEANGDISSAVQWARRAAELSGHDERTARYLFQLLLRNGDRAGAMDAYRRFARRLREEFGVEPAAETRAVFREVAAEAEPGGRGAGSE